jgi:hypothetical protein
MGRSDGSFPSYKKLDVHPAEWPKNYYHSSRSCIQCGLRWPDQEIFSPTPCCNSRTLKSELAPEMRWVEACKRILESRFDEFYEEYNEGLTDDQLILDEVVKNGRFEGLDQFIDDLTQVKA